jgi:putative IMPACT (imprinted ancient) family translation regulator
MTHVITALAKRPNSLIPLAIIESADDDGRESANRGVQTPVTITHR